MRKKILALRAEAKQLDDQARAIWARHNGSDAEHTEAELAEFDEICSRRDASLGKAAELEAREDRLNAADAASIDRDGHAPAGPHNDPANTRHGRHGYSLLKALRQSNPAAKQERLDGLELEVHQELARSSGRTAKGLFVPWDLPVNGRSADRFRQAHGVERRDLTISTGAGAVHEVTSTSMIELLRNMMLMFKLGARVLTGLNGNFSLPKQTAGGSAYWVAEGVAVTESNQTIGSVDFSPSTVGAFTDYSRAFLNQTSVDAENFIREDLATVLAIEMDRVGINGSGSGAQPTGIVPDANVNVVALATDGAAMAWANLVDMEAQIEIDNALTGNISFVTSPAGRKKMKLTTKVASSTFGDFLWDRDGTANGYAAYSSNQVPANLTKGGGTALSAAILGDFSQAIYAMWGGLDVLVDPYTGGSAGNVRIVELQDCDFQIRHPVAFAVIKDYVTT